MADFIQKHDPWGISRLVKEIWLKNKSTILGDLVSYEIKSEFCFWVFFNQFVPEPYRASTEAVHRHFDDIVRLCQSANGYNPFQTWIKDKTQMKCVIMNADARERLDKKEITLPTYEEIEREKMKWQSNAGYRKSEGFSQPIVEEYIQLNVRKKGGE